MLKSSAKSAITVGGARDARLSWIDSARGLTILLVIYGHVVIGLFDAHLIGRTGFLGVSSNFLYTFHMPTFMFLAGLFIEQRVASGRRRFIRSILPTVVWPYFVWGTLVLLTMHFGSGVRNAAGTMTFGWSLLWTPIAWLWFLWALALYHLLTVLIPSRGTGLLLVAMMVYPIELMIPLSEFAQQLAHFLPFYALGVFLAPRILLPRTPDWTLPAAALLALGIAAYGLHRAGLPPWSVAAFPAAIAGTVLICSLSMLPPLRDNAVLIYLGRRSLPIYICHIFFLSLVRVVLVRVAGETAPAVHVPIEFAAGVAGPLALYWVASRLGVTVLAGFGKPVGKPAVERRRTWPAALATRVAQINRDAGQFVARTGTAIRTSGRRRQAS